MYLVAHYLCLVYFILHTYDVLCRRMAHSSTEGGCRPCEAASTTTRVCILGHSYVRRLGEFMESQQKEYGNLGLSRDQVVVECIGIGGATVCPGNKCIRQQLGHVSSIQPAVVFVHMGENDLRSSSHGRADQVVANLSGLLGVLSQQCQIIYVGQLLPFPATPANWPVVVEVNNSLQAAYQGSQTIHYWRHHGFWNQPVSLVPGEQQGVFDQDGIHLSQKGQKRYWHNVRAAVRTGLKKVGYSV